MSIRWKFNYGLAAVVAAIIVIVVALAANPIIINPSEPDQIFTASSFLVMLTDPPTVPNGTTLLNLTYTDISLHVTYPNETATWIPVNASGTVNLLSLVNMSQTLAATTIPAGSTVDKIQFSIADVKAVVNGETYTVTALSNAIVMTISNNTVNQTLSGVLIDFNPTLVQIQSEDDEGNEANYYVLVPSATARIISNLRQEQSEVGTVVDLENHHRAELEECGDVSLRNVTITSASVAVNGNVTTLSVTINNEGNSTFNIFGLTMHGEYNTTRSSNRATERYGQEHDNETYDEAGNERGNGNSNGNGQGNSNGVESGLRNENGNGPEKGTGNGNGYGNSNATFVKVHPRTIPFKVNGTSLVPLLGPNQEREDEQGQGKVNENIATSMSLEPGETVTLTFSDVISLQSEKANTEKSATVITPTAGSSYTIRLMGEGSQTFNVTITP